MKRWRWAVGLAILPVLGLGVMSEVDSRGRIAAMEREIPGLRASREELEAIKVKFSEYRALQAEQQRLVEIVGRLLNTRKQDSPAVLLRDFSRAPEAAVLRIDTLWAQDGFFEVAGTARSRQDVNRAGQALEQRGGIDGFDLWRFDPDGGFALLGRLPEATRGQGGRR